MMLRLCFIAGVGLLASCGEPVHLYTCEADTLCTTMLWGGGENTLWNDEERASGFKAICEDGPNAGLFNDTGVNECPVGQWSCVGALVSIQDSLGEIDVFYGPNFESAARMTEEEHCQQLISGDFESDIR